ncbi:MAG: hypothetical protein WKF81_07040 [Thermomicrobiales bacterium]
MSTEAKARNETISDWIGDIVALESHVEEAMDKQLSLKSSDASVTGHFKTFHDAVRDSKHRAVAYQNAYGSTAGNPIIKVGASLLGKAAGLVDKIRHDSASKALRDDYTAYNHLAIGYTMLHATALAFKDADTTEFAKQGMITYAGLVQHVNQVIGSAVIADLASNDDAPAPDTSVSAESRRVVDEVWKTTSTS